MGWDGMGEGTESLLKKREMKNETPNFSNQEYTQGQKANREEGCYKSSLRGSRGQGCMGSN
jgi:hypothetical protein